MFIPPRLLDGICVPRTCPLPKSGLSSVLQIGTKDPIWVDVTDVKSASGTGLGPEASAPNEGTHRLDVRGAREHVDHGHLLQVKL